MCQKSLLRSLPCDIKVAVSTAVGKVIVTFGSPPAVGVRGADYLAQVTINSRTAQVEQILGGP